MALLSQMNSIISTALMLFSRALRTLSVTASTEYKVQDSESSNQGTFSYPPLSNRPKAVQLIGKGGPS